MQKNLNPPQCNHTEEAEVKKDDANLSKVDDGMKCIKALPRSKLIKMGFGDLNTSTEEESDFLSQSSISESDFHVFLKDDFMNLMQDINIEEVVKNDETASTRHAVSSTQSSSSKIGFKLPKYDPSIDYSEEYYEMFEQNMALLERLDQESNEHCDLMKKIYRIKDFYDLNIM